MPINPKTPIAAAITLSLGALLAAICAMLLVPTVALGSNEVQTTDACPKSYRAYASGGKDGALTCSCRADMPPGYIFGTDIYTDDSDICTAARHAGAITSKGGTVKVIPRGERAKFEATERNGIASRKWGEWLGVEILAEDSGRLREDGPPATDAGKDLVKQPEHKPSLEIAETHDWAGNWVGIRYVGQSEVLVDLSIGEQSSLRMGAGCQGRLIPTSADANRAEFEFQSEGSSCQSGTVSLERRFSAKRRPKALLPRAGFIYSFGDRLYSTVLAKPVTKIRSFPYRYIYGGSPKRFEWPAETGSMADALARLRKLNYKCLSSGSRPLNLHTEFGFPNNGNPLGGRLYLLSCAGNCEAVTFSAGSTVDGFAQYMGTSFPVPALYIETNTFFRRTHKIGWYNHPNSNAGAAEVSVALFSQDPFDYGPGCKPPFD